jgi:hypothetical protein
MTRFCSVQFLAVIIFTLSRINTIAYLLNTYCSLFLPHTNHGTLSELSSLSTVQFPVCRMRVMGNESTCILRLMWRSNEITVQIKWDTRVPRCQSVLDMLWLYPTLRAGDTFQDPGWCPKLQGVLNPIYKHGHVTKVDLITRYGYEMTKGKVAYTAWIHRARDRAKWLQIS